MNRLVVGVAACLAVLTASGAAVAQSVKSEVRADNGVMVTVYSDEFAERYEYTAPRVDIDSGFVLVARTDAAGEEGEIHLIGSFVYSGDWRYYNRAVFRGGEEAGFLEQGRDVGSCRSSRYSRPSCTLSERFAITVTPTQLEQYTRDGNFEVQIRSSSSTTAMVTVPITYFEAVEQVADSR